ncbi:MAG: hypothetical protein MUF66_07910, partial [Gammaproteobacteria bacterium]|nr:hypothetical protein [Gammaproteobacteria bacterium]
MPEWTAGSCRRSWRSSAAASGRRASWDYFSAQRWGNANVAGDPARVEEGRRLHADACEDCHEKEGRYQDLEVPRIAGQWPEYLYDQLRAQRDPKEKMPQPNRMRRAVERLT